MGKKKKKPKVTKIHIVLLIGALIFAGAWMGYITLPGFEGTFETIERPAERSKITLNLPISGKVMNEFNSSAVEGATVEIVDEAGDVVDSCTTSSTSGEEGSFTTNLNFLSGESYQLKVTLTSWNTVVKDITIPYAYSYEQSEHDIGIVKMSWRDEACDALADYDEDFGAITALDISSMSGSSEIVTWKITNTRDDSALGITPYFDKSDDTGYLESVSNYLIVIVEDNSTNSNGGESSKVRMGGSWTRLEVSSDEVWFIKEMTGVKGRVARDVDASGNTIGDKNGIQTISDEMDFSSVGSYTDGTRILEITYHYCHSSLDYINHYYALESSMYDLSGTSYVTY